MMYFLSLASRHYTYQIFLPPDWFLQCFSISSLRFLHGSVNQGLFWVLISAHIHPIGNLIYSSGSKYLYIQMIPKFISFKFHIHMSNYLGNIKDINLHM